VELLEARLQAKQAVYEAALEESKLAKEKFDRLQALEKEGAVPHEAAYKAQAEAVDKEIQLRVLRAELVEPELLLKQARRRLEKLQQGAVPAAGTDNKSSWADDLFEQVFVDFGVVQRGKELTHTFHLTNTTKTPVHISGVRVSCGCLTATPFAGELAPGRTAGVMVRLDTRRFIGTKTIKIYVQFDRPEAGEAVLLVRANSRDDDNAPSAAGTKAEADSQKRLQELEKKLDAILKEMEELKRELKPQKPGGRGAQDDDPETVVFNTRTFQIPIEIEPAARPRVKRVILWSSAGRGESWRHAAAVGPGEMAFTFDAPHDGVYWFNVAVVDDSGKPDPADMPRSAALTVRVDTASPGEPMGN
jgi:hypothetical protein